MKKIFLLTIIIITCLQSRVFSQAELKISENDLYIELDRSGGYHLWIKKKEGIGSVLITESSRDPARRLDSYALRSPVYNPVNGDEKRMLDGKFLDNSRGIYSLIDSTPEKNEKFGLAFHIYIPQVVIYGYRQEESRYGEITVKDGTFLNIRAFSKPYADYTGQYLDNPFMMEIYQKPFSGPPEENYMPDTVKSYKDIAEKGKGKLLYTTGKDDLLKKIDEILGDITGKTLDLVLTLDTTLSMKDDIPYLQKELTPLLSKHTKRFEKFRIGLVYYRDYGDQYLNKSFPFETNMTDIQKRIDGITVYGGRDIPEAIFEALYESITAYSWEAEARLVILIGDAPPHPQPKGKITEDMVYAKAEEADVTITAIILPQ